MILVVISIAMIFCKRMKKINKKSKLLKSGDMISIAISTTKIFGQPIHTLL
jgi:hypothetical protein